MFLELALKNAPGSPIIHYFLSGRFRLHRTAGEGGDYLLNFSLLLSPASQEIIPFCEVGGSTREKLER